jgi:hypothetical protein
MSQEAHPTPPDHPDQGEPDHEDAKPDDTPAPDEGELPDVAPDATEPPQ